VNFNQVPLNARASNVFLEEEGKQVSLGALLIGHRLAVLGQYNSGKAPTANVPALSSSEAEDISAYGRGSMLHLMLKKARAAAPYIKLYAVPLADAGTGVAAVGSIQVTHAPSASGTIAFFIGGQKISVAVAADDTVNEVASAIEAAIDAALDLPVTASVSTDTVTLTAKWAGVTGNDIRIQRDLDSGDLAAEPASVTVTITSMATGANNPAIATALAALGGTWYTAIATPYQDATSITAIEAAALVRAAAGVKKPFLAVFGYNGTKANFQAAVTARNSQFCAWVPVEDSPNPPFEIAAVAGALYGACQGIRPGTPMRYHPLTGIRAGAGAAWTDTDCENTLSFGGSTTENLDDGTVKMVDFMTTYKTNSQGTVDYTYRDAYWLGNWQTKLYSLDALFGAAPFSDAIVVDNATPSGKDYVIRPNTVKAYAIKLIDELWVDLGLTKERAAVVAGIVCEINSGNPGRIDISIPDVFAAGLRIIAGKVAWSFYAPTQAE
jgi:phage tail sheath gpL-like